MCWWDNPAPVYYTKCKHTRNVPAEAKPYMCVTALARNPQTWCDPIESTWKGSSTNRRDKCEGCRNKSRDPKPDYGDGAGEGGSSTSYYDTDGNYVQVGA